MMRLHWYLVVVVLHLCFLVNSLAEDPDMLPQLYNLSLQTEVDDENLIGTIYGGVTIELRVLRETRTITLSSKGVRVSPKVLLIRKATGGRVTVRKLFEEIRLQQFGIIFNSLLWLGEEYTLTLQFTARMSRISGYFLGAYIDASRLPQWVAASQMAPDLGNTVFPCFEDPNLLSIFILTLAHPKNTKVVSNMLPSLTSDHDEDDYMWTSFLPTLPMSVRKLIFSINQFIQLPSPPSPKTPILMSWMRPKVADQGEYAIKTAPKIIEYFVNLTLKPHPSIKVDQLVLPDTAYESHEHLELVSYPERLFLYSKGVSSLRAKQNVASRLAHEFAHHWFSVLENPALFWLHYGFSDYLACFAMDEVTPQWRLQEHSMIRQSCVVLDEDSRASVQPVSLAQGSQSTDIQAHRKTALIFRMLHSLIGTQVFVTAMRLYLQLSPKGSTNQTFLWKIFQEESDRQMSLRQDIEVSQLMDSWTMQPGYPLVTVERNYTTNQVTVTQQRYLRNSIGKNGTKTVKRRQCWWVPLTFTSAGRRNFVSTLPSEWLTCQSQQIANPLVLADVAPPGEWVVFNIRLTTPCRINYDDRNWQLIEQAIAGKALDERFTRAQLIDDVLNLAATGDVTYDLAFSYLRHMSNEDDFIVWEAAARSLEWLYRTLHKTAIFSLVKTFVGEILQPKFNELFITKNPESANKANLKRIILHLSCLSDLSSCADLALKEFSALSLSNNPIPVDQRETIYCTAIRFGTEADWTLLRKLYKRSNVVEERRIILSALSCSRETWALRKMLALAFGSRYLPKDDIRLIFTAVAQNPVGNELAKRYLMDRIKIIIKLYENSTDELAQLLIVLMDEIMTVAQLDLIRRFIKKDLKNLPGIEPASRRILEIGQDNIIWHNKLYPAVVASICNITGSIEPQCIH
ncbi:aminopeptidase N [Drosophila eugracilis]|uniref:aminopeptidase N n=1 Tax=Drosophila eugracilis TaxID=29029 RepID=UPI0007E79FBD|nr:aminopeptidase N [Drosophila eugracilis]